MSLSKKQRLFFAASHNLITYALNLGYEFTYGDAYRADTCTHGHEKSTHRSRLAIDLNLFVDNEYITDSEHPAWKILHDYFELLGGSPMISDDANHFSFEHNWII